MGGGLAAVSHCPRPRHRAPDRTQLLPRQVISGRDATAQDLFTYCLKSKTLSNEERKPYWSALQALVHSEPAFSGFNGCLTYKFFCVKTKFIPVPSRFVVFLFFFVMSDSKINFIIIQCVKAIYLFLIVFLREEVEYL